jgi:hypothetical protein
MTYFLFKFHILNIKYSYQKKKVVVLLGIRQIKIATMILVNKITMVI